MTLGKHGFSAGDTITVADITFPSVDPNGSHTVSTVVDEDTFQYVIASGGGDETYTSFTGVATSDGFSLVPGGDYVERQTFEIAGNAFGVSSGIVRFTVTGNTTFAVGDKIRILDTDAPQLLDIKGRTYTVTQATSTDIYFAAPLSDVTYASGSASDFIQFDGKFSEGVGFLRMPAPPWAVYFQRRLWAPYFYTPTGTASSPTYTDRNTRDEIAASDILDSNTFDSIESQFRITAGVADYLVGMHPFYNDSLLVLNRNTLHLITGTQGSLADTVVRELTREGGCDGSV